MVPCNPCFHFWYPQHMAISDRQMLDSLSRTPFVDSAELARILDSLAKSLCRSK